jgi:DNA mismatch repair ATPase MutS
MKAFLMYRDRDIDRKERYGPFEEALMQDLELGTLFNAMGLGDNLLSEVAKTALLCGLSDPVTILYRQDILRDCLSNPSVVRDIYAIAVESIEKEKNIHWSFLSDYPDAILRRAIEALEMFVGMLKILRSTVDDHAGKFQSEGFTTLFETLRKELDDNYFGTIGDHLRQLKFRGGVLISAGLGKGNKGSNYVLRKPQERDRNWISRIFDRSTPIYTFRLHPRDESGARALSELRDRGIDLVANALAQSTDHILSFFRLLRTELGFYIGCLNLYGKLDQKGYAVSFPEPVGPGDRAFTSIGLYDPCLALTVAQKIVSNDVNADGKDLMIITGANQGGKSTFLRSLGVSQLMMQCGMFVPAVSFRANVCEGMFTHYKREEDSTMKSGKFDEELCRMSDIVDNLRSNSLLLFSESFAATNELEGSEIASQIVRALLEKRVKVLFVTHLYEFARRMNDERMETAIFLRAERRPDGTRTFRVVKGEPLETSYGKDLYNRIFVGAVSSEIAEHSRS